MILSRPSTLVFEAKAAPRPPAPHCRNCTKDADSPEQDSRPSLGAGACSMLEGGVLIEDRASQVSRIYGVGHAVPRAIVHVAVASVLVIVPGGLNSGSVAVT